MAVPWSDRANLPRSGAETIIGLMYRLLGVAAAVLIACQDDVATGFPDGLEPLEDNTAPALHSGGSVEGILFTGFDNDPKILHGRGVILASPARVWAAAKDPEHLAARCETDRHTVELGLEPQYELSWEFHYEVDEVLTVAWDELWRFGTIEGRPDAPTLAMIRYQKVFGSDFISLIEGSIQIRAAEGGNTEVQLIEHLSAIRGSLDVMRGSMRQRYLTLAAVAHDQPVPACP